MAENNFLGRGFHFPIENDHVTGRFREVPAEEDIRQAIGIILSTKKGERMMRPDFGCDIYNFMFGTMDYTSCSLMGNAVLEALIRWEPRIRNIQVDVTPSEEEEGVLLVNIEYIVRSTNNMYNMVYPFYISEGTGGEVYETFHVGED